jgi:hypothetical protein
MKIFICSLLIFVALAGTVVAGQLRTITRDSDPVIVSGNAAGGLTDQAIAGLRAYALREGKIAPVPFQVDEKTGKGDFIFPDGPEKNPQDGDGIFNGNDELVIMARDLGDQADSLSLFVLGWERAVEIVATDPQDGGRGFAYVVSYRKDPPTRAELDYVNLDPATSRVSALFYNLGFSKEAPMALAELSVTSVGGGDGVDYCDRLKARLHCVVAGVEINKTEEDFTNELVAWIDGPVRVVRRTRSRLILFWNIPSPSARLDNIYYYNSFSFPTEIYLPIDVGFAVKDAHFRVSVDSPKLAGERRYRNSLYPEGVIQDGTMSDDEKTMAADRRPFSWSSTGTVGTDGKDHGAWFNRLVVEGDNPDWKPRIFYVDNEKDLDPPDQEPGSFGNGGYQIDGLTDITAGTYRLDSVMYATPAYEPEMAPLFMRTLDFPILVEVKDL